MLWTCSPLPLPASEVVAVVPRLPTRAVRPLVSWAHGGVCGLEPWGLAWRRSCSCSYNLPQEAGTGPWEGGTMVSQQED